MAQKKTQKKTKRKRQHNKMSQEEKDYMDMVEKILRYDIMGYDEVRGLSTQMWLRVVGLRKRQYIANNNSMEHCNYTYEIIYHTILSCYNEIKSSIKDKKFEDDYYKFSYIIKIIDTKLPIFYRNMLDAEKALEQASIDVESDMRQGVDTEKKIEYKRLNDNGRRQKLFADMW